MQVQVALWLLSALPCSTESDRVFKYRSYRETHAFFQNLQQKYPNLVDFWYAQDAFPEILPQKVSWGSCEGEPCKTLIVRIANKQLMTNSVPEVFFSGALHGDERLGPITVTELAAFLCEEYERPEVKRLVDRRATWIMPLTNAHGYAARRREENGLDPNRDFPYLQDPKRCMMTQTARAVNELFRRHLFQFMITFHGGMRALTYEWGSRNHLVGRKSTESPDEAAFTEVGKAIQGAAGTSVSRRWFYPLGPINDLVYPVDGGMEDWSYAAGWEASPTPITVCKPTTYGGYAEERTKYRRGSISTLVYLAEMDDAKSARESSLGHRLEIFSLGSSQGHVARNLRMCLKLIELARPEVVVETPTLPASLGIGSPLSLQAYGVGCFQAHMRLLVVPSSLLPGCSLEDDGAHLPAEKFQQILTSMSIDTRRADCRGLTLWAANVPPPVLLTGHVPMAGEVCLLIAADFDAQWARQKRPDPRVAPRSHAARARLEESYEVQANDGPMVIKTRRTKLFVAAGPITVKDADHQPSAATKEGTAPSPSTSSASFTAQLQSQLFQETETSTLAIAHLERAEEADARNLVLVASFSFLLSLAVGCAMLLCNREVDRVTAKDAQYASELAEMVGRTP